MSFPRYPKYKDSGVEWLGEVPEHWLVKPIRLVAKLESGHTPSRSHPEYWEECTVPWITLSDVWQFREGNTKYIYQTKEKVSELGLANSSARLLPKNTVILSRTASVGFSAIMGVEMATTQDFANWICGPGLVPEFLLNVFRAMNGEFRRLMMGSTHNTIYMPDIQALRFVQPPRNEQILIVDFLDRETAKIDELIAEQRRLIELLKEKRQAVISHAVTKGLDPNVRMKPSGVEWLGDVPEHWRVIALKRIADIQTGVAKGKDTGSRTTVLVPYLRVANVQDGYLDLEDVATIEIPAEDLKRYALRYGDVLMNEGGDFDKLGRGCVWEGQIVPCITQNHVFSVRPRQVSSNWLSVITRSGYAQFYFIIRSKQSTNLASISSTNLMELPVVIPSDHEQIAILFFIANQTSLFDKLTSEAERSINLLQERRTALISAAVTGKIDVRGLADTGGH
jgi:type I restriction enzyme S subunit